MKSGKSMAQTNDNIERINSRNHVYVFDYFQILIVSNAVFLIK